MKTLAAMLCCLLLAACSAPYKPGVAVQAAQVRAALDRRHGFELKTYDDAYSTTSRWDVRRAIDGINRMPRGEIQDCDDDVIEAIESLRTSAYHNGASKSPAAFLMPVKLTDGRRHAIMVVLCETKSGAEWAYFDVTRRTEISRSDIAYVIK